MGPCLGTVGRPGGNSKSVVLISRDDAGQPVILRKRACLLLLLLLQGGWERKSETQPGYKQKVLILSVTAIRSPSKSHYLAAV